MRYEKLACDEAVIFAGTWTRIYAISDSTLYLDESSGLEYIHVTDEPDTHLNPMWTWKYLDFLDDVVHQSDKKNASKNADQTHPSKLER